jgi:diaminopimelate decarboxylase
MMRRIDQALSVRGGRLYVEDVDCVALTERFGTPLYVVSEDQLRRNARSFRQAFASHWQEGQVRILPSLKANYALALRHVLSQEGMGCDTFGPSELHAALRSNVLPELISVNGSAKSERLIEEAVAVGARITLDAARELPLIEEAARRLDKRTRVRMRLRPDLSGLKGLSDLASDEIPASEAARAYKAGVPTEDAVHLGRMALASQHLELTGVHVHLGRHRPQVDMFRAMIRSLVELVAMFVREWDGWLPQEIDLGGGFAVPRDPTAKLLERVAGRAHEPVPSIEEYAEGMTSSLRMELRRHGIQAEGLALEIEPGRRLFADAGIHLASVLNTKRESVPKPWRWIETDTTEMFLPDSLIEHNRWSVLVAGRVDAEPVGPADIVGISCGFDLMVPAEPLAELGDGEILAFLDTGAYQDASASNFNALPRPATVLVHGSEAEIVKRAESVDDVFSRDVVPDRLVGSANAGPVGDRAHANTKSE